ncbi:hypothetical protein BDZ45DRAFT_751243 [Acephala macrosclerotiorum]|nr:hypothetical protein BDZ45DRAFT_751243 [Acephala macrosclerotiorum]
MPLTLGDSCNVLFDFQSCISPPFSEDHKLSPNDSTPQIPKIPPGTVNGGRKRRLRSLPQTMYNQDSACGLSFPRTRCQISRSPTHMQQARNSMKKNIINLANVKAFSLLFKSQSQATANSYTSMEGDPTTLSYVDATDQVIPNTSTYTVIRILYTLLRLGDFSVALLLVPSVYE